MNDDLKQQLTREGEQAAAAEAEQATNAPPGGRKPYVGQIVLYQFVQSAQSWPAVVTYVHSPTCINVSVVGGGSQLTERTSVGYSEEALAGTWRWIRPA